ncbi:DUF4399 domain-containing protein [Streptomyces gibsoniae]|uniref:DUF4399 domain-containing protein n=1 Tax=Streptomyces gibsoniae TaxID=3075529 RepID=A0ABU2U5Z6_9ACTN|nr:DUF4399 domain-containing protein [Streptomyces sp. DSM 41699]MDT0468653.1 DUF4399 domain-containing protein [Streptomyces sp. DSM 41699]
MAARVYFVEPADGTTVRTPVQLKFNVEGMELRPAGDMTPNTGFFTVLIDGRPVPQGDTVPPVSDASTRAHHEAPVLCRPAACRRHHRYSRPEGARR